MTLAQIKAMFAPGSSWNAATPYPKTSGPRTVQRVAAKQIIWTTPQSARPLYMDLPTAAQVIEARDGFVRFYLFAQDELLPCEKASPTVTLSRQDALPLEVPADDTVTT